MPSASRFLAIETSTDTLSVALGSGAADAPAWHHAGPGGAMASTTLLPLVRQLLDASGWALNSLDAVVFGRGPGSFTGLRTACAVAQGLAYGAQDATRPGGLPVLPVDTLLALAEEARHAHEQAGEPAPDTVVALLDARMSELYVAPYALGPAGLSPLAPPRLCAPKDLAAHLEETVTGRSLLAGNVFETYAADMAPVVGQRRPALPTATALLRLAPPLFAQGAAVAARDALPLYVRDKVAQTTDERERLRMAAQAAAHG
ncbi:tRNA (adenosine(37)-N6)-threonylcarbamoyltransferase complex dimerization subunit type 1 TsaB [Hydrogenophaga sp. BPS33]|uniref:tRNA (adenosine(37)-N6)-threonylcarbamoyltransferase complex dimerization subunit type 1 TsaB n=1 Tax=Hydrogenophaga sp. BPS33 TaxID=2651974 RepID=UPI0013200A59|nr:tRNA (adenosine(37)-N6)-threonylcarbamoyltransferase complex dimerization subunit type 1 TsaB [Hydrogenophaga sp. BPS33]QHE88307.1 tRNA (adenosine(37)-N6)-threonylcarbamoyltransferase complex dimerization subunit type 1 TsaB [Hydrogenophaga sp. BPS33]